MQPENITEALSEASEALAFAGAVKLDVDPFSGFKVNTSDLRVEGHVLYVVRRAAAAYVIAGS